jgi:adenine-specific DNA-methyltransferase
VAKEKQPKQVDAFKHTEDKRKNNPTAEAQSLIGAADAAPKVLRYPRNPDLDPQLVWRGKDAQDSTDLAVQHTPLYIQEKVHPKVLVEDLLAHTKAGKPSSDEQLDLFSDFNGVPDGADKTEFYQHDQNWTNRMILGDSLQVMASLAERDGLRGKVQAVYIDPPYGIRFNSNFMWSTTSMDVKDGSLEHITREPEQVKAFRDTWRDGVHSYLSYLRDRLLAAKDLLHESGSIFVQISDENVHRVRAILDEIFGDANFLASINFRKKTMPLGARFMEQMSDHILWYAKDSQVVKWRDLYRKYDIEGNSSWKYLEKKDGSRILLRDATPDDVTSGKVFRHKPPAPIGNSEAKKFSFTFEGRTYPAPSTGWGLDEDKLSRLVKAGRVQKSGNSLGYLLFHEDSPYTKITNPWTDTVGPKDKTYVVQTANEVVQRCLLLSTDPGDLVLDPTCGSGTTAYVAELVGRRWITIDTSRVALALARARLMGAQYPYYYLADSSEGQQVEAQIKNLARDTSVATNNIRLGFVYERAPHITIKSIVNDHSIDEIHGRWHDVLEPLRESFNQVLGKQLQDWEMPRTLQEEVPSEARKIHEDWWKAWEARRSEINRSILSKADYDYLYENPYIDSSRVRVAGPFTVESLSPHRSMIVDVDGGLVDPLNSTGETELGKRFTSMILENLKAAGVQQADKSRKIDFTSVVPWSGKMVCAEGRYMDETGERRAAIFVGPEFGTVLRADLVEAAREASDGGFHVLIACAFNYEAHATEFDKLGAIPVLKARMNADLHMGSELKETSKANLFVVFGEPDIELQEQKDGRLRVEVKGVDVFKPQTGEVVSEGPDGIACWFIDTDYNEESFFVRHAYFLGADDPYDSLKRTLKAEINEEAWESLHSAVSRPFDKPKSGRIAVKVINHLGDEVMKVYKTS